MSTITIISITVVICILAELHSSDGQSPPSGEASIASILSDSGGAGNGGGGGDNTMEAEPSKSNSVVVNINTPGAGYANGVVININAGDGDDDSDNSVQHGRLNADQGDKILQAQPKKTTGQANKSQGGAGNKASGGGGQAGGKNKQQAGGTDICSATATADELSREVGGRAYVPGRPVQWFGYVANGKYQGWWAWKVKGNWKGWQRQCTPVQGGRWVAYNGG